MNTSEKIKIIDNKIEQNKTQTDVDTKLLAFLLYDQEMLVSMSF